MKITFIAAGFLVLACTAQTVLSAPQPLSATDVAATLQRIEHQQPVETTVLLRGLVSDQTFLRASAARLLGQTGDLSVVPALIAALADDSMHDGAHYVDPGMATTRWWANDSLKKLTRQDSGFRWDAPPAERQTAIARWQQWAATSR